jgi:hypothetical protein
MPDKIIPANIEAGHKRDEAKKVVNDQLEEKIETQNAAVGIEAIDESKLKQQDNEILSQFQPDEFGVGRIPIKNAQPGFRYAFLKMPATCGSGDAKSATRQMIDQGRSHGYQFVQADDPEAVNLKGNDAAETSSLRGVGDTCLARISEEAFQRMDQRMRNKQARAGAIEDNSVVFARERGLGGNFHAAAGDFRQDPVLARGFSAEQASSVTMRATSTFTEGDLHRGSIPGLPRPGTR